MKKNNLDAIFQQVKDLLQDKEYLFDTVMDAIGDLVSIQDLNMKIVYQNKAMKKAMGVHEGEYCFKIYEKKEQICEECPIIKSFKTGEVSKSLRVGVLASGAKNRFENVAAVLRNKKGKIVAGVEVCRDVEEREGALADLETFRKLTVGRELKMIDLEKENEDLKKKLKQDKGR